MKFYLVDDDDADPFEDLDISHFSVKEERHEARHFRTVFGGDITPVDQSLSEISKCAMLKDFLNKERSKLMDENGEPWMSFWTVVVDLKVSTVNYRNGRLILPRDIYQDALSKLADFFEGITAVVELTFLETKPNGIVVKSTVSSKEMTLLEENEDVFNDSVLLPAAYFHGRDSLDGCNARATITVSIPDDIFTARVGTVPLNLKILEDGVLTDVTIVCGDGIEIKTNRVFLAARSSVFLAMFQTGMKESRESTVEIPDMEEKTVRAFLKYLYYDDTKDPEDDYKVALELFKAGHKYDVKCLEEKMKELLLNVDKDIDMEDALKLFLFARNLMPAEEELMKKAAKVLERYSKGLQESPEMQELFRTDYKAALELFQYSYKRN